MGAIIDYYYHLYLSIFGLFSFSYYLSDYIGDSNNPEWDYEFYSKTIQDIKIHKVAQEDKFTRLTKDKFGQFEKAHQKNDENLIPSKDLEPTKEEIIRAADDQSQPEMQELVRKLTFGQVIKFHYLQNAVGAKGFFPTMYSFTIAEITDMLYAMTGGLTLTLFFPANLMFTLYAIMNWEMPDIAQSLVLG